MQYTMEQLVKALSIETLEEVSFGIEDCECSFDDNLYDPVLKSIADMIIKEIDIIFDKKEVSGSGLLSNEAIEILTSMLVPYSRPKVAEKLLNIIEGVLFGRRKKPNGYIKIVVNSMNSDAATNWYRVKETYR